MLIIIKQLACALRLIFWVDLLDLTCWVDLLPLTSITSRLVETYCSPLIQLGVASLSFLAFFASTISCGLRIQIIVDYVDYVYRLENQDDRRDLSI